MNDDVHPRKAFVTQVVTVVHTCHSHNIAASRKRLESASNLFRSICVYDSLFDSLVNELIDEVATKLSTLRYVDGAERQEITRIKSDCLLSVRRLHDITQRMELRDHPEAFEHEAANVRTTAFGWMKAAV